MTQKAEKPKTKVVYTALIGGYENLNEKIPEVDNDTDLVCFTDDGFLSSSKWQIVRVVPRFSQDPIRSARYLKIMGPDLLNNYMSSLWIDNSVMMLKSPSAVMQTVLQNKDFALPVHDRRKSVAAEFDTVDALGFDDFSTIYEQMFHYAASKPWILEEKPYFTAFMARRHTEKVRAVMHLWWEHILRYSRRDQLSLNYVLDGSDLLLNRLEICNQNSQFHRWPLYQNRMFARTKSNTVHEALASVAPARLGRLENQLDRLQRRNEALERRVAQRPLPRLKGFFRRAVATLITGSRR